MYAIYHESDFKNGVLDPLLSGNEYEEMINELQKWKEEYQEDNVILVHLIPIKKAVIGNVIIVDYR